MFGFRDISHDVCNVLIHVSGLRSLLFICYVYGVRPKVSPRADAAAHAQP